MVECLDDVKRWAAKISRLAHDDATAHLEEDALYRAVLEYIARGGRGEAQEMAQEALGTQALDFQRWYE